MNRLAALATRYVGRRVRLTTGQEGTITRVTAAGFTVSIRGVQLDDIEGWVDD